MAQLLVRNLPDQDVQTLREASDEEGRSVESFLRDLIAREASRRRRLQALDQAERLAQQIQERWVAEGYDSSRVQPSEEIIREGRTEMDAKWDR